MSREAPHRTVRAGPADLAALFEQRYDQMVRLAYLMVDSNAIAEEVVQDAFAELGRRWDEVERPAGYLRRSVINGCRSRHRRWGVRRAWRPVLVGSGDETTTRIPDPDETWPLLDQLTWRRRAAVVLRYYLGCDDAEIAETLDCTRATVRSLVHRALNQLEEELAT